MDKENLEALQAIVRGIKKYILGALRKAKFDVTKKAIVIDVLDDYKYKISADGQEYTVPCCTEQKFNKGEIVLMLVMQNNYNNKYIIGRAR